MRDIYVTDREAVRSLAASLGDRANEMAAEGLVAEVPALWESAIAELPDEASQAVITLAYAWYQVLHGEVEHGVRLAAELRECRVPQMRGQVRVLVRNRLRVEPEVVARTWREVVGTALPEWSQITDEEVDLVAEWVSAVSWEESEGLYESHIRGIRSQAIDAVLEEIRLGDPRAVTTVEIHRAILTLGGTVGFRCVGDPRQAARVASAAISAGDWEGLRACGMIERRVHGWRFLGGLHAVAADLLAGGDMEVTPALTERVADLAEDAEPWERQRTLADVAAIGDGRVGSLLGLLYGNL